jgi:AcrR family transcriptional regulator
MEGRAEGLRERKKQQTRQLIGDAALRLFAERGFDGVTVGEIAREADVSEKTVFNYFRTKDGLVYAEEDKLNEFLISSVRERAPGQSVLEAYANSLIAHYPAFASGRERERHRLIARITASPALRAREDRLFGRHRDALAALLFEETGARVNDVVPPAVAGALVAFRRAVFEAARATALAGAASGQARFREDVGRVLGMFETGLGSYAVREE